MSQLPCVSVVVPFFNSEKTLEACLESLFGQKNVGGPYEIIVIDNRSPDGSASIVARYDGLIVLDESTPGAYAARNTGIRQAKAPIIALTDADCVVEPDWLRSILDAMQDPQTAILIGHCRYPAEASLPLRLLGAYENAKAEYVTGYCAPAHHFAYANNMAVRRSVFEELGPFMEWKRAADSELVHRLAAQRPNLRFSFEASMRVTHLEFVRGRQRAQRLQLYQHTNSKITTFRELSVMQRLAVLVHLMRGQLLAQSNPSASASNRS